MKKDQYFNVEVNFMSDEHVAGMMMELDPGQSVGIYFMLLLHLRKKDDYTASCSPQALRVIAWQNRVDVDMVDRIVHDFGLFEVDGQRTYLGHPIPPQAPPQPSFSAVWDERRNRWGQ